MKRIKIYKLVLSSLLAIVLLYFSFARIEWLPFWKALKSCDWIYVILSMLIAVLAFYLRSLRWQSLLCSLKSKVRLFDIFNSINISLVWNMLIPRSGEFARCAYIVKHSGEDAQGKKLVSYENVLGTAIVDRSLDILSLLVLALVVLFLKWQACLRFISLIQDKYFADISLASNYHVLLIVITLLLIAFISLFFLRKKVAIIDKGIKLLKGVFSGIVLSFKEKKSRIALLYSALVWFSYVLTAYAVLLAIQGIDINIFDKSLQPALIRLSALSMADVALLVLVGSMSSFVPVPGGFGAFHILITLGLSVLYGVPEEIGIIFATLTHESQAIIQILVGGLSFIYEYFVS